ncbi:hypothetical protein DICA1_C18074 [Diutina catenulata]
MSSLMLYRALVRRIRRRIDAQWVAELHRERPDLTIPDPERFARRLRAEMAYLAREEFSFEWKDQHGAQFVDAFTRGAKIVDDFDTGTPTAVMAEVERQRRTNFTKQEWRHQNLVLAPELAKAAGAKPPGRDPADDHEGHLLRRWFKHQQKNGSLPIPQKLPYVERVADTYDNPFYVISESTKSNTLQHAYDPLYVEAIIKPGLAFDINKHHFLDKLDQIVNERGPYEPRIRFTSAGPGLVPYIRMPYPQKRANEQVAMTIKKWITADRIARIWDADKKITSENSTSDGGYLVKHVSAFNNVVYPRSHYEKWAREEAQWDRLMDGTNTLHSWLEPLEVTSKHLRANVRQFEKQCSDLAPLKRRLAKLTHKQKTHYDRLIATYGDIATQLQENVVFKHSDLVNRDPAHPRGKQLGDYMDAYQSFHWGDAFYDRFKF